MTNCIAVYRKMTPALENAYLQKKKFWSNYNAFVSINVKVMPAWKEVSARDAIIDATGDIIVSKGSLTPINITLNAEGVNLNIEDARTEIAVGDFIYFAVIGGEGNPIEYTTLDVTQAMIDEGVITFPPPVAEALGVMAYWYKHDRKKVSTQSLIKQTTKKSRSKN